MFLAIKPKNLNVDVGLEFRHRTVGGCLYHLRHFKDPFAVPSRDKRLFSFSTTLEKTLYLFKQ
jgi:hypothetical protein